MTWRNEALCKASDVDMFYPPEGAGKHSYEAARQVCKWCPVKADCLDAGIDEGFGMWGGTTPAEREAIRGRRYPKITRVKERDRHGLERRHSKPENSQRPKVQRRHTA